MVQSEMGAGGPAGATLVVHEGIKALSPSAVILVGVAFGLIPEQQRSGDILVARQLAGYELQKIEQGSAGEEIIRPRGDRAGVVRTCLHCRAVRGPTRQGRDNAGRFRG